MIGFASNTGTRRNLAALRASNWGLLLTPENPTMRPGFTIGVDNGAWGCFQRGEPLDVGKFSKLYDATADVALFVVVPDIVAGGLASLEFSSKWIPQLQGSPLPLLALQDGMEPEHVAPLLRDWPRLGLFLGGSTDWKLKTIYEWGHIAAQERRYYHVGRVNSARRIRLCAEAGASSFDGTSATRYAKTLPLLDTASRQPSLLSPR